MKIPAKKIKPTTFLIFFGAIFVTHRESCDDYNGEVRWGGGECVGGWVKKIATEKIVPTFLIFLAMIFITQLPPSTVLGI